MGTAFYKDYFLAGNIVFHSEDSHLGYEAPICETIIECTWNYIYYGLRSTGGIADH